MSCRAWIGPSLAACIFCLGMGGTGALIYSALADKGFGVEPDYYRKALDWNRTAAQRERNAVLGWTVSLREAGPPDKLRVLIRDARERPVTGATVVGETFANSRSADRFELDFVEADGGEYTARRPPGGAGLWRVRIEATLGSERFTWESDATLDAPARECAR